MYNADIIANPDPKRLTVILTLDGFCSSQTIQPSGWQDNSHMAIQMVKYPFLVCLKAAGYHRTMDYCRKQLDTLQNQWTTGNAHKKLEVRPVMKQTVECREC